MASDAADELEEFHKKIKANLSRQQELIDKLSEKESAALLSPSRSHTGSLRLGASRSPPPWSQNQAGGSVPVGSEVSFDPHLLEVKELLADEESLVLLKQQLSQVNQLKLDNGNKDRTISDLRAQLADSARYKDQAMQLRGQLTIIEERAKIRESESVHKTAESMERARYLEDREALLRRQLADLEEAKREAVKVSRGRIEELEETVSRLRQELQNTNAVKARLESELEGAVKTSKTLQRVSEDRDQTFSEANQRLQERLATLEREKLEADARASEFERVNDALRRENTHQVESLALERKEREALEREKLEHAQQVGTLNGQLSHLKSQLDKAHGDVAIVEELRRELEIIPVLRQELRNSQEMVDTAHQLCEKERAAKVMMEEQNQKLQDANNDLSRNLKEVIDRYSGTVSPRSELQEKRRTVELLNAELSTYRQSLDHTKDELAQSKQLDLESQQRFSETAGELQQELNAIQKMVDRVLNGQDICDFGSDIIMLPHMQPVAALLISLKGRIKDSLRELETARARVKATEAGMHSKGEELRSLEDSNNILHREISEMSQKIQTTHTELIKAQDEKTSLEVSVDEYAKAFQQMQTELQDRTDFVNSVLAILGASKPSSPFRSTISSGSPSKSNGGSQWISIRESVSFAVKETVAEKEQLAHAKELLSAEVESLRHQLQQEQASLRNQTEQARSDRIAMEDEREAALSEQRAELDKYRETLVNEARYQQGQLEGDLKDARAKLMVAQDDLKKFDVVLEELSGARHDNDTLSQACEVLVRGLRPLRVRVKELTEQKRFMSRQIRTLEHLQGDVRDLMLAMTGDPAIGTEGTPASTRKVTFRVAVLAVIAKGRLERLAKCRGSFIGNSAVVAGEIVYLGPKVSYDAQSIKSLPLLKQSDTVAEAWHRIVSHYDPELNEASVLARSPLVDQLNRGLREWRWHLHSRYARLNGGMAVFSDPYLLNGDTDVDMHLATIRKSALNITKRLHDSEVERDQLQRQVLELNEESTRDQQKIIGLESTLESTKDLANFLENRVHSLEEEIKNMVPMTTHNTTKDELKDLKTQHEILAKDLEKTREDLEACSLMMVDHKNGFDESEQKRIAVEQDLERARHELGEKGDELASLQSYMKRKAQEIVALEDDKKRSIQHLQEARQSMQNSSSENQSLIAHLKAVEKELEDCRRTVSRMEQANSDLERRVEDDGLRISDLRNDLKRKDREALNAQEMIRSLSEAHQLATEHASELERQLTSSRRHEQVLRTEVQSLGEREEAERVDREKWARARLELLNMRSAAQADLQAVLGKGSPSRNKESAREHEELKSYIATIDNTLSRGPSSNRGVSPALSSTHHSPSKRSSTGTARISESPQVQGLRLGESLTRNLESAPHGK